MARGTADNELTAERLHNLQKFINDKLFDSFKTGGKVEVGQKANHQPKKVPIADDEKVFETDGWQAIKVSGRATEGSGSQNPIVDFIMILTDDSAKNAIVKFFNKNHLPEQVILYNGKENQSDVFTADILTGISGKTLIWGTRSEDKGGIFCILAFTGLHHTVHTGTDKGHSVRSFEPDTVAGSQQPNSESASEILVKLISTVKDKILEGSKKTTGCTSTARSDNLNVMFDKKLSKLYSSFMGIAQHNSGNKDQHSDTLYSSPIQLFFDNNMIHQKETIALLDALHKTTSGKGKQHRHIKELVIELQCSLASPANKNNTKLKVTISNTQLSPACEDSNDSTVIKLDGIVNSSHEENTKIKINYLADDKPSGENGKGTKSVVFQSV